jgi:large-conductance mechanosensitive channel
MRTRFEKKKDEERPAPAEKAADIILLKEIRDLLKKLASHKSVP